MKKIKNTKGFTLMEMLIVVAIIAILIAIAIPTFNSSLNKAKVATDEANIRSGYAAVMAQLLTSDTPVANNTAYKLKVDGSVTVSAADATAGSAAGSAADYKTKGKNTDGDLAIGGIKVGTWDPDKTVTYTVTTGDDGYKVKIEVGK